MDIDHSGSRLLSGSRDNSVRIFDFNGMKSTMRSFRKFDPSEGHPMLAVSWSPTGPPNRGANLTPLRATLCQQSAGASAPPPPLRGNP